MVLLKEPEALLVVIISKNSNILHFAVYTTCMPSCHFVAQLALAIVYIFIHFVHLYNAQNGISVLLLHSLVGACSLSVSS